MIEIERVEYVTSAVSGKWECRECGEPVPVAEHRSGVGQGPRARCDDCDWEIAFNCAARTHEEVRLMVRK